MKKQEWWGKGYIFKIYFYYFKSIRIREFKETLKVPYNITPNVKVQEMILNVDVWNENDLFRVSKLQEQKNEKHTKIQRFDSHSLEKITKSIMNGKDKLSNTPSNKLSSRDWQLILSYANIVNFKKDDTIIQEGSENKYLYKIKEGICRVEKIMVSQPQLYKNIYLY